jgi:hypothetical protein
MEVKKFGQTETEAWAAESLKSRQVVSEILKFGVSQKQILQIISLLSLELEDRAILVRISNAAKEALDEAQLPTSNIITE